MFAGKHATSHDTVNLEPSYAGKQWPFNTILTLITIDCFGSPIIAVRGSSADKIVFHVEALKCNANTNDDAQCWSHLGHVAER